MKKHTRIYKQAVEQKIYSGIALTGHTEAELSKSSLVMYTLTPEQLKEYNDKHGWPTRPLNDKRGDRNTIHRLRQPRGPVA